MPLLVNILLSLKSLLLIITRKCFCFSDKEESQTLSLIIDIIFASFLITGLVVALILMIGLNRHKSDIWTNNLMNGLGQGMITLPLAITFAQIGLTKSFNANLFTSRPSLRKKMEIRISFEIKNIMVTY